jgi:hypothetical protein
MCIFCDKKTFHTKYLPSISKKDLYIGLNVDAQ